MTRSASERTKAAPPDRQSEPRAIANNPIVRFLEGMTAEQDTSLARLLDKDRTWGEMPSPDELRIRKP